MASKKEDTTIIHDMEIVEKEDIVVEKKQPKKKQAPAPPVVPDAQIVFDAVLAQQWLVTIGRPVGVYQSVRFEPEGMPEDQINTLMILAGLSVVPEYTDRKKVVHKGKFFVPKKLADSDFLSFVTKVGEIGDFVEFERN